MLPILNLIIIVALFSSPALPQQIISLTQESPQLLIIDGDKVSSRVGYWLATGDFNGDGYPDLICNRYSYVSFENYEADILYGPFSSGKTGILSKINLKIVGQYSIGPFQCVDLTGDKKADLVVQFANNVCVLNGGKTNPKYYIETENDFKISQPGLSHFALKKFADSSPFNLLVSDEYYPLNIFSGRVDLYNIPLTGNSYARITSGVTYEEFGSRVGFCDFNNDHEQDLIVVGANEISPIDSLNSGRVYIFNGTGVSSDSFDALAKADIIIRGTSSYGLFGKKISSGDMNHDGSPDLLIGTGESINKTYGFFGGHPFTAQQNYYADQTADITFNLSGSILIDNIDGDSRNEVIISSGSGVFIFLGKNNPYLSKTALDTSQADLILRGGAVISDLGSADLNNDKIRDLVIGSTSATVGTYSLAGQVYVFFGWDSTAPAAVKNINPVSHLENAFSNKTSFSIAWAPSGDAGTGLAGYYVLLDTQPLSIPNQTHPLITDTVFSANFYASGNYYFHLRPVDQEGNLVPADSVLHAGPFKIDLSPPQNNLTLINTSAQPLVAWTSNSTFSFVWNDVADSAGGSGLAGYDYKITASPQAIRGDSIRVTTGVQNITARFPDGKQYFHLSPGDQTGNFNYSKFSGPYWVDTEGPQLQVTGLENKTFTNYDSLFLPVPFSLVDTLSGVDTATLSVLLGSQKLSVIFNSGTSGNFQIKDSLPNGIYRVFLSIKDKIQNTRIDTIHFSVAFTDTAEKDSLAPLIFILTSNTTFTNPLVQIKALVQDSGSGIDTIGLSLNGSTVSTQHYQIQEDTLIFQDTLNESASLYTLVFIALDSAGNIARDTFSFLVDLAGDLDTLAPAITFLTTQTIFNNSPVVMQALVQDSGSGVDTIYVLVKNLLFSNIAAVQKGDTTIATIVPDSAGAYQFEVHARDSAGNWAAGIYPFTYSAVDNLPPTITLINLASPLAGEPLSVQAVVRDTKSPLASVKLLFQEGGNPVETLSMAKTNSDTYLVVIPPEKINEQGLHYSIIAADAAGNKDSSYATAVRVILPNGLTYRGLATRVWQLIAFPIELTNKKFREILEDDWGAYDPQNYRVFGIRDEWDDNRIVYLEGDQAGPVEYGEGYWIHTRNSNPIRTPAGRSVSNYSIKYTTLAPGWNLIGNPYPFVVDWSGAGGVADLTIKNNPGLTKLARPVSYSKNKYYVYHNSEMQPWQGYWFFNHTGSEFMLFVPPKQPLSGPAVLAKTLATPHWEINFRLQNRTGEDGSNRLGISLDAQDGWDVNDLPEAPRSPDEERDLPQLSFTGTHLAYQQYRYFSADIRSIEKSETEYQLAVTSHGAGTLQWERSETNKGLPQSLVLFDLQNFQAIDLLKEQVYRFDYPGEREFKVFAGRAGFVNDQINRLTPPLPEQSFLSQNIPNPFNPQTTLHYGISKNTQTEIARLAFVSLSVFNMQGQLVRNLVSQPRSPGFYQNRWDGRDHQGRSLSAGVYIYRLGIDQKVLSKKMLLWR